MDDTPSEEPLPPPVPLTPSLLPAPINLTPHQFTFPGNTAGESAVRPQRPTIPPQPAFQPAMMPPLSQPSPFLFILSSNSKPHPSTSSSSPSVKVPYSTQSYRKRKLNEEQTAAVPTKRYKERSGPSVCSKCGKHRTDAHKQYFGNWYCPEMPQSYETWRQSFGDKYKKKKS